MSWVRPLFLNCPWVNTLFKYDNFNKKEEESLFPGPLERTGNFVKEQATQEYFRILAWKWQNSSFASLNGGQL